jgi:hypothetical protein
LKGLSDWYTAGWVSQASYLGDSWKARGILCNAWRRPVAMGNATSQAYYYFSRSDWVAHNEQYRNMLKRIIVNGSSTGGNVSNVSNVYEFIDLVPSIKNDAVFDPCQVLYMSSLGLKPSSTVFGCGCDLQQPPLPPAPPPSPLSPPSSPHAGPLQASLAPPSSGGSAPALGTLPTALISVLVPFFTLSLGVLAGKWYERKEWLGRSNVADRRVLLHDGRSRGESLQVESAAGAEPWGAGGGWGVEESEDGFATEEEAGRGEGPASAPHAGGEG